MISRRLNFVHDAFIPRIPNSLS